MLHDLVHDHLSKIIFHHTPLAHFTLATLPSCCSLNALSVFPFASAVPFTWIAFPCSLTFVGLSPWFYSNGTSSEMTSLGILSKIAVLTPPATTPLSLLPLFCFVALITPEIMFYVYCLFVSDFSHYIINFMRAVILSYSRLFPSVWHVVSARVLLIYFINIF